MLSLDQDKRATSHSLKATSLAWCSRYGIEEDSRILLGHHEHPSRPLAVYSRDMLSRPLKHFEAMLLSIRQGVFRPDTSRSGWTAKPASSQDVVKVEDSDDNAVLRAIEDGSGARCLTPLIGLQDKASEGEVATPQETADIVGDAWEQMERGYGVVDGASPRAELPNADDQLSAPPSSSSDASSDSDSSSVHEETMVRMHCEMPPVVYDLAEPCYQHKRSKVLHLPSDAGTTFLCGRRVVGSYEFLQEGPTSSGLVALCVLKDR